MNRVLLPIVALTLSSGISLSAAPLLHFDFNTSGSSQQSIGTSALNLITREGATGVDKIATTPAGPDGSSVLNFSGAAQNTTLEGLVSGISGLTTDLGSFTITAWIYNNVSASNSRIFYLRGGSSVAIDFNISGSTGNASQLILSVNGSTAVGSNSGGTGNNILIPNANNTWVMVGVSYNALDGSVIFYSGSQGQFLSYTSNTKLTNAQVTNSVALDIGNIAATSGGRVLNAYLDEVQFYNSALTPQEIQAIYQSIPEPGTPIALLGGAAVLALAMRKRQRLNPLNLVAAASIVAATNGYANEKDLFINGSLQELQDGHPRSWPVGSVTDAENYEVHVHQNGSPEAPTSIQIISHAAETSRYMAQVVEVQPGATYRWSARLAQNGGRGLMWAAAVADVKGQAVSWEARTYLSSYIGHPLYPHFVSGDKMRGSSKEGWREESLVFTVPENVAKIRFSIGAYFSTGDIRVGPMSLVKTSH